MAEITTGRYTSQLTHMRIIVMNLGNEPITLVIATQRCNKLSITATYSVVDRKVQIIFLEDSGNVYGSNSFFYLFL